jgi:hypothetical protein
MPDRVLVHRPPPDPPQLADRPLQRPARGEEFQNGFVVADYNLAVGDWRGELIDYEVWVVPCVPRQD